MREAHAAIAGAGADLLVVGTGAAYQAAHLMEVGYPAQCLVDPDAHLYTALGIGRVGLGEWLKPSVMRRYVSAARRGSRQGRVTGDWRRLSGVAIVDVDRTLRYRYAAGEVGEYPPVDEVMAALRRPPRQPPASGAGRLA